MARTIFHKEESYRMAVWKMDEDWATLCREVGDSALVEEALRRFASTVRRMEWLSVRALLRQMEVGEQHIAYFPSGRPYLESGEWEISISHTKGYVAVILGRRPVAIDIEYYSDRVFRVRDRFMRTDESVAPYEGEDTWSLLLHWSAKETIYKRVDEPDIDLQTHLSVSPFVPHSVGEMRVRVCKGAGREYAVRYLLHPHFVLTWEVG